MRIYFIGNDKVVGFAVEELLKYIKMMSIERLSVIAEQKLEYNPSLAQGLWVGLFSSFPDIAHLSTGNIDLDDAVYINVTNGAGVISGINPRSVLLGVYRFLTEAGCRWVRPGVEGEYIPNRDFATLEVTVEEQAAYRHRGICIEGAVSRENVLEMIDWAPKLGFNSYFIQFREAYAFYERWYTHQQNPKKKPAAFSREKAGDLVREAENEIKKRGLLYHAVGHGWTCEPLGIPGLSWEQQVSDVSPEIIPFLAEINKKRALWGGVPLNTNLCYSNPQVRQVVTDDIVNYLNKHENIDFLHVWLADGTNNHCECARCRQELPSDFYIRMLNEVDEKLTEQGIDTKIVFLIYVDLLWPPQANYLRNPERFVLMFAPITRSYSRSFSVQKNCGEKIPDYKRNHLEFPSSVEENLAFLKAWQGLFTGDSFDFDYHLMWAHYYDPGYYQIARIIHQDVRNLQKIGLNGLISCQVQRVFFPTGFPMYILGRTLWNDKTDFDITANEYFKAAFGEDGEKCLEYLSMLSRLFVPEYIRGEKKLNRKTVENWRKIPETINNFMPTIQRNCALENNSIRKSWYYLMTHAEFCKLFSKILVAKAEGDKEKTFAQWGKLKDYLQEKEDETQPVFDLFEFVQSMEAMNKNLFS